MNLDKYAKAVIGALMAAVAALGTALTDGQITATEWVLVVGAGLAGLAAVWATPNAPEVDMGEG